MPQVSLRRGDKRIGCYCYRLLQLELCYTLRSQSSKTTTSLTLSAGLTFALWSSLLIMLAPWSVQLGDQEVRLLHIMVVQSGEQ